MMEACSICTSIIGDEVAYGDIWDGQVVCASCIHAYCEEEQNAEKAAELSAG